MKLIILFLLISFTALAQVEKEITPQVIAGDTATKIIVKHITYDSEGTEIFVTDAVKMVDGEEVVYYQDIAFAYYDIPVQLTEEEKEELPIK